MLQTYLTNEVADQQISRNFKCLNTYCYLTIFREVMLLKLFAFLVKAKANDLHLNTTKVAFERTTRAATMDLEFLKHPEPEAAVTVAHLDPKQWPLICLFFEKKGIAQSASDIEGHVVAFHPLQWKDWCMSRIQPTGAYYLASYAINLTYLKGVKRRPLIHEKFILDKTDHGYYIIRPIGNTKEHIRAPSENGYVLACEDEENFTSDPDLESQWKVVCIGKEKIQANVQNSTDTSIPSRLEDGHKAIYMLSTRKWPAYFAYMTQSMDGSVRGHYGNPGEQGHWMIEKLFVYNA